MVLSIKCDHASAMAKNCKFCPDCGQKIVHKWITIRCRSCGHYRMPETDIFGKVKPEKKYCFHCGSDKWNYQYYYESTIPDRIKTISIKKIYAEEEYNNRFKDLDKKPKIWITR